VPDLLKVLGCEFTALPQFVTEGQYELWRQWYCVVVPNIIGVGADMPLVRVCTNNIRIVFTPRSEPSMPMSTCEMYQVMPVLRGGKCLGERTIALVRVCNLDVRKNYAIHRNYCTSLPVATTKSETITINVHEIL
jgi:hypothetical protein